MTKTNYTIEEVSWDEVKKLAYNIAKKIKDDNVKVDVIIPVLRGGMPLALLLSSLLNISEMACIHIRRSLSDEPNAEFGKPILKGITNDKIIKNANVLIVDDTLDSKETLDYAKNIIQQYNPKNIEIAILYNFNKATFNEIYSGEEVSEYKWVVFPWEEV